MSNDVTTTPDETDEAERSDAVGTAEGSDAADDAGRREVMDDDRRAISDNGADPAAAAASSADTDGADGANSGGADGAEGSVGEAEAPASPAVLELESVSKVYDDAAVVEELSLAVREGELLTLLGPSGCGKTTTLRLIAGLDRPEAGRVKIRGDRVAGSSFVPPEERDVGVVFQEFALFPHLTARENVAFGLSDLSADEREQRVDELLELVGLPDKGGAKPDELSGGQQQRVALARSLAPEPQLLLLDEPFSNLDVDLRVEMREEVRRILKEAGVTAVNVTHDQEEAMSISDRVAVMRDGRLDQVGTPEAVFEHPTSRFVASFLGHASFIAGEVDGDVVHTGLGDVRRDRVHGLAPEYDGTDIDLLVRPDDVSCLDCDQHGTDPNGTVVSSRYLGPTVLYQVELDSGELVGTMHNHADESHDDRVCVQLTADHDLAWFPRGARRIP